MAGRKRSSSKRYKKKYRKWKRRATKKTYRKKAKTIYGRKTVPISRRHLKKKREQLYKTYIALATNNVAPNVWFPIWTTTGNDAAGDPYMVMPQNQMGIGLQTTLAGAENQIFLADGDGGISGRVWFYSMLDLRFNIAIKQYNQGAIQITQFFDYFRIVIVRQKAKDINDLNAVAGLTTPILTKDWNILFDKTYSMTTGYHSQGVNPGQQSLMQAPKMFRFKLPFKYRAEYQRQINNNTVPAPWEPPLNTYVFVFCQNGQIAIDNITCRQYFTMSK